MNSQWSNFPSFANIIDFSALTDTIGLKTLDLDEFMQHRSRGRPGHAAAGLSKSFFSSYNSSVHTWCNANRDLNVTDHISVRDCKIDRELASQYPTLLKHIQRQLDQQHGQVEWWEGGYYRHDCRVLNVGSAFLVKIKFHDPAEPSFASFFYNYPLVQPWTSIMKTLLAATGGNFSGVHVRVKDGNNACSDSTELYQDAARDVWANYNNEVTTFGVDSSNNNTSNNNINDKNYDSNGAFLVIVGRVNGNSKLCLQQALQLEAAAALNQTGTNNNSSSFDIPQVVAVNDLIDNHEEKKQLC
jgi:hypothetical protein